MRPGGRDDVHTLVGNQNSWGTARTLRELIAGQLDAASGHRPTRTDSMDDRKHGASILRRKYMRYR